MKIVVVDYQLGNINSIINMLRKIGIESIHSNKIDDIQKADRLILPGVGSFDHGMRNLHESGLVDVLNEEVLFKKKPILGICLGMQLFLHESEEGNLKGLGWIEGKNLRFIAKNDYAHIKVPHMGWNVVDSVDCTRALQKGADPDARYYFVHSYHAVCKDPSHVLGTTCHGYPFPAIIGRDHIFGVQFHPEKSHKYGMHLLKNFVEYESC